jgi:ABC-2 type transport system ATP-binding protein
VREFLRYQAGRGRAVLVSSHLLAEVSQSVDDIVVISQGRLRASGPLSDMLAARGAATLVRTRSADRLAALLTADGGQVRAAEPDESGVAGVYVDGRSPEAVGLLAAEHGIALVDLRPHQASLEEAFLELTEPES